jgi:hypothetical protein
VGTIRQAVALLAVTAAASGAAACGGDEPASQPVRTVATADPVVAFAPLVSMHPRAETFPLSAERFLYNASLKWAGDDRRCPFNESLVWGRGSVAKNGPGPRLSAARLGGNPTPYRARSLDASCKQTGPIVYDTTQRIRPYGPGPRPAGLRPSEGFYLDLLTDVTAGDRRLARRDGQLAIDRLPVYYERETTEAGGRPALRLTYWLLYGRSAFRARDGGEVSGHEGDWERVEVLLRRGSRPGRYLPLSVRTYEGERTRTTRWRDLERVDARGEATAAATHPVLYAGRNSHTPYARPGRYAHRGISGRGPAIGWDEAAARCADCPQWRTWERLRLARAQPWYGFGGGWGLSYAASEVSGPLGPSPYTTAAASDAAAARSAVRALQRAFEARDPAALCELMTANARRQAGSMAHGKPGACVDDVRDALGAIGRGGGWGDAGPPAIDSARVLSDTAAVVTVTAGGGWRAAVPLAREDGRWMLDSFFGTPAKRAGTFAAEIERARFPAIAGTPIAVRNRDGSRCYPLTPESFPRVGGGCSFEVRADGVDFPVLSPFGDFRFRGCDVDYTVRSDPAGRTWTTSLNVFDGRPGGSGCSDVEPCRDAAGEELPWRGRLRLSDGALIHRTAVCLDTCVGMFVGELTQRIARTDGRLRATASPRGVAASGFRFPDRLDVDMNGVIASAG